MYYIIPFFLDIRMDFGFQSFLSSLAQAMKGRCASSLENGLQSGLRVGGALIGKSPEKSGRGINESKPTKAGLLLLGVSSRLDLRRVAEKNKMRINIKNRHSMWRNNSEVL